MKRVVLVLLALCGVASAQPISGGGLQRVVHTGAFYGIGTYAGPLDLRHDCSNGQTQTWNSGSATWACASLSTISGLTTNQTLKAGSATTIVNAWPADDATTWGVVSRFTITENNGNFRSFGTGTIDGLATLTGGFTASAQSQFSGLSDSSYFLFGANQDVYIRGGKAASSINIGDATNTGTVNIGSTTNNTSVTGSFTANQTGGTTLIKGATTFNSTGSFGGAVNMNSNKITSCANGTVSSDVACFGQIATGVNAAVSGTSGRSARFSGTNTIGNGAFTDDGTNITASAGTVAFSSTLSVAGKSTLSERVDFGKSGAVSYTSITNRGVLDYDTATGNTVLAAQNSGGTSHVLLATSNSGNAATQFDVGPTGVSVPGTLGVTGTSNLSTTNTGNLTTANGTDVIAGRNVYANNAGGLNAGGYLNATGLAFAFGTNGAATGKINASGYADGATQFRDLEIDDGKGAAVATFAGSGKTLNIVGDFSVNTTSATIAASTGNTVLGGTLDVKGLRMTLGTASINAQEKDPDSSQRPTIAGCGTGPTVVGSDKSGYFITGTTNTATCTLTFHTAFSAASCIVFNPAGATSTATAPPVTTTLAVSGITTGGPTSKYVWECEDH